MIAICLTGVPSGDSHPRLANWPFQRDAYLPRIEAPCLQGDETLENPEKVVRMLDSPKICR